MSPAADQSLVGCCVGRGPSVTRRTDGAPRGTRSRSRIATPSEAVELLGALSTPDRASLGLAIYAGLRLGELLALDWSAIDLPGRTIQVERAWDHQVHKFVEPKSKAGKRIVPIMARPGGLLDEHRDQSAREEGLATD